MKLSSFFFFEMIFEDYLCTVADLEIRGGGITKNFKPHPQFTWSRPSLGRYEAFLCFCRGAATIFER